MRALLVLSILVAMAAGGCKTTNTGSSQPLSVSRIPYTIAVLDEVTVKFPGGADQTLTVPQNGVVETPGGPISATGMGVEAFRARVQSAFPRSVSVAINEFRPNRVTVLGEVFHQIHTDLGDGPMRVMDAIASANGFTPLANRRRVRLLRQNAGAVEVYELDLRTMMVGGSPEQNLLLRAGDVLTVPRNFL